MRRSASGRTKVVLTVGIVAAVVAAAQPPHSRSAGLQHADQCEVHTADDDRPVLLNCAHPPEAPTPSSRRDDPLDQWSARLTGRHAFNGDLGEAGEGVLIVVLDSGADYWHDDLQSVWWRNPCSPATACGSMDGTAAKFGWDFVASDDRPYDDLALDDVASREHHGHGTHVAGVLAAADDDSGITGVAPRAQLLNLRVVDASNDSNERSLADAIDYTVRLKNEVENCAGGRTAGCSVAAETPLQLKVIISASVAHFVTPQAASDNESRTELECQARTADELTRLQSAVRAADAAGILIVAAANNDGGNNNDRCDSKHVYPAGFPAANIISVAGLSKQFCWSEELDADASCRDLLSQSRDSPSIDAPASPLTACWNKVRQLCALGRWSSFGAITVDLAAPGDAVVSTAPWRDDGSRYIAVNGTSFATPQVSGAAAVYWSNHPDKSAHQVRQAILDSAFELLHLHPNGSAPTDDIDCHTAPCQAVSTHGMLNFRALMNASDQ